MRLDNEGRFPLWASIVTITLLSVFSWAVVYALARFIWRLL